MAAARSACNGGRWCGNNLPSTPLPSCHATPTGAWASARSRISGISGVTKVGFLGVTTSGVHRATWTDPTPKLVEFR
jgi:hypothetical protein